MMTFTLSRKETLQYGVSRAMLRNPLIILEKRSEL
jgi:hypothetical protein